LEARKGVPPDQILALMGKELVPNIQSSDRANVFYAVIDRRGFELSYSGAGQIIALLYSYADNKLRRLEGLAAPFAKDFNGAFTTQTLSLNPRDRVVLCSEGVIKALNNKGEAFGEERLYRAVLAAPRLGVHELRNEILFQVEKFTGEKPIPQDLTVVVTEVKDRVIKLAKT
jgi:phosphoserine phosphatase RsbU/P